MIKLASLARSVGLALTLVTGAAWAQGTYPSQPIRIIVPTGPGGINDVVARLVAPGLSERLGQPVLVENRPGAGSMLGTAMVAHAKPDGHTLLMVVSTLAIHPSTLLNMSYDGMRDLAPITLAVTAPVMVVVPANTGPKTVKEFIAQAKAKPDGISYGSAGFGTNPHLAMELLAARTGIKLHHVPFNGGPAALTALLGGHVAVMSNTVSSVVQQVRGGRLHSLGVSSNKRLSVIPDIPTFVEQGVTGFEPNQWSGLLAPAKTPPEIIARLHKETVAVLRSPEFVRAMTNDGVEVVGNTPEEFAAFIKAETDKWTAVTKAAGIKPQ